MTQPQLNGQQVQEIRDRVRHAQPGFNLEPYEVRVIAGRGLWSSGSAQVDRIIKDSARELSTAAVAS